MASGSEALTLPTIQVACGFGGQKEGIGATVHCPLCISFLKSRMGYCFEGYFSRAVTYVKRAHSLLLMFITKLLRIVYTYVPRLKRPVVTRTFIIITPEGYMASMQLISRLQLQIDRRGHIVPEVVSR